MTVNVYGDKTMDVVKDMVKKVCKCDNGLAVLVLTNGKHIHVKHSYKDMVEIFGK